MNQERCSGQLVPVILAGGKGERFWPLSRRDRPKQFLCLDGSGRSLLQATADRLLPLAGDWSDLWVATASHLADGVRRQLPDLPDANLLIEPEGRDTAPALAWATLETAKRYGEETIVGFFPADHWIGDRPAYDKTLLAAATLARKEGAIATLGIAPDYASTGYGYIEQGASLGEFEGLPGYRVSRFTEKPDRATAERFVASGRFSWNSGMFVFGLGTMLAELEQHAPDILNPLREGGLSAYSTVPKLSIDYALMEKTQRACVLPAKFGWDDLGDWNAVERLVRQEGEANVELADCVSLDAEDCIVYASNPEETIALLGVKDVTVVRDGNATLVVHKSRTQDIKKIVKQLQADARHQNLL